MPSDLVRDYRLLNDCNRILLDTLLCIPDEESAADTLVPGWSVAHLTAHIHHNAEALLRLIAWATSGKRYDMYSSRQARDSEIEITSRKDLRTIKELLVGSTNELQDALGSLPLRRLDAQVETVHGREIPVGEILWIRIREVAVHAVDYNRATTFADLPGDFLIQLFEEVSISRVDRGELGELCGLLTGRNRTPRLSPWL